MWRTFGFAVGVLVFSVTTALIVGDQQKASVIVPTTAVQVLDTIESLSAGFGYHGT